MRGSPNFTAQQAAEKVIKAIGLKLGITLWEHSVTELLSILSAKIDIRMDCLRGNPPIISIKKVEQALNAAHDGLSDIDILVIVADADTADYLERARPFHKFFNRHLAMAVDVLVAQESERESFQSFLAGSILVAKKA